MGNMSSDGLQVSRREGQDNLVFSILLHHMRGLPEGAPQQTVLLQEASRQASSLPTSFAIPALISALQVCLLGPEVSVERTLERLRLLAMCLTAAGLMQ